jgi:hypothetical protein
VGAVYELGKRWIREDSRGARPVAARSACSLPQSGFRSEPGRVSVFPTEPRSDGGIAR